jgi:hypothetical protein
MSVSLILFASRLTSAALAMPSTPARQSRLSPFDTLYDNEEEFFAFLVANIYMSETGKTRMRANHQGHAQLSEAFDTS